MKVRITFVAKKTTYFPQFIPLQPAADVGFATIRA